MQKMSRSTFLKISTLGIAGAAAPSRLFAASPAKDDRVRDEALLQRVIESSDRSVERYLSVLNNNIETRYYRTLSDAFASYTASYCHPESSYHASPAILEEMEGVLDTLLQVQYPDGTLDSGGNRKSPPDTAFYLEKMCPAAALLRQTRLEETKPLEAKLNTFLERAGEGIRTGGVHTPNHRWVVTAVLAHLYIHFQDEAYRRRLDEWLAEGIYLNEDGNYPERSRNYSIVENRSFITIGRLLNRPELFEIVKKNLESNYYYMEPNGELITLDSRRQDQNYTVEMARYYFQYKYLAVHFDDPFLGAVANTIEQFEGFDRHVLSKLMAFMEEPVLLSDLQNQSQLPKSYTKVFPTSGLVRIRREATTASIFAGNDKPVVIASGQSNNPTFFTFRKGEAILHSVRLSTAFFNTGYVRGDGVQRNGNQYTLTEKKEAYYYHPMPGDRRDAEGDYTLSPSLDGRFWSKMDFEERPKDTLTLDSIMVITEENGAFVIDIDVDGPRDIRVTLEFRFNEGGALEGVTPAGTAGDYFLTSGTATYTYGEDTIEIGPGLHQHNRLRGLDGEMYSTHFGTLKGQGLHVYLTGYTPFKHTIRVA